MTISSNNQAPYGAIVLNTNQQDKNIEKDSKESGFNINDTFKSSINIIKQAMPFDGAYAKVSFRDKAGSGIVEMNLTEETFNKLKSKFTTDIQSTNSANNEYIASGSAESYLSGMYEVTKYLYNDINKDNIIDTEENKDSRLTLLGYDDTKQMPIYGKLKDYTTEDEFKKYYSDSYSIDYIFNDNIVKLDPDIDGTIQKKDAYSSLGEEYKKLTTIDDIKSPTDLIKLLSIFLPDEDTDDEKKKKKAKELGVDVNVLAQMAKDIKSFMDGSSPLVDLLSKLKSSVSG